MWPLIAPVNVRSSATCPLLEDLVAAAEGDDPAPAVGPPPQATVRLAAQTRTMARRGMFLRTAGKGNRRRWPRARPIGHKLLPNGGDDGSRHGPVGPDAWHAPHAC